MRNSNVLLKVCILMLVCSVAVMFAGCGKSDAEKYDADKNTLYVQSDSSVISTIVDTLGEEHYDVAELEEFTKNEIEAYNYSVLEDVISLVSFSGSEDKNVKLIMKYTTSEHYTEFNKEKLFVGSVATAMDEGYMFETGFVEYKELKSVALIDVTSNTSAKVVVMEPAEEMVISLPGKVSYISSHVTQIDKKTVQIPADCRSYIIYE